MVRKILSVILNILIIILTGIGTLAMLGSKAEGAGLTASGFSNLKFFTVLSNEFCGIVAILWLIFLIAHKTFPVLVKLMAAAAVALTFIIIAAFLAPLYPNLNLYEGGNFYFHLIVPLTAMAEFMVTYSTKEAEIPFRYTLISAVLSLIYGLGYLVNILINGIGEWPDTNDWYGFLNWGYPVGFMIFGFIILMNWGMACIMRFVCMLVGGKIIKKK